MLEEFARFEFKYVLDRDLSALVKQEVSEFMEIDPFVKKQQLEDYYVRSLYFENKVFQNFYEKIDGVKNRTKYRLRTYSAEKSTSPVFLESKNRNNNRVHKLRQEIRIEDVDHILHNPHDILEKYRTGIFDGFYFECIKYKIKPVVLIEYMRAPFVSEHDGKFRITFDTNLRGGSSEQLWGSKNLGIAWKWLIPQHDIMEVKFNRRVPVWFHRIVQSHGLQRVSISKFVLGIDRLNLAKNLS